MGSLEAIAVTALAGDALQTRSAVQDFLSETPRLSDVPRPAATDPVVQAMAAAILELLAMRGGQDAPAWTRDVGPAPVPVYLVQAALTMRRLRILCEQESPEPLRRRQLFAPPNYLATA